MALTTITNPMVAVNAIQGTLIADNAITAVHIATNAVSGTLIADNAVTAVHIAQNTITVTQLADDAVEADKIADGVITTNHLNKTMISSQTEVTAVAGDFLLIGDTSDSNNLKKIPISGITNLVSLALDDITTGDAESTLATSTGSIILDSPSAIKLDADGGEVQFKDGGTEIGVVSMGSQNMNIESKQADKDIVFKGIDGSSDVTALTLDMSDAGTAIFNHDIKLGDNGQALFGAGNDLTIYHDGSDSYIKDTGTGNLLIQYSDLYFSKDAGSTHSVVFRSTGRVGIGTTGPDTGLHLSGADNTAAKLTLTNTAPSPDNSWSLHPIYNGQDLILQEDGTARVTFTSATGEQTNTGSQPAIFLQDTTAGGGAGNGGQIIFKGHHAGSSDGFREFAKILGLKENSTGGSTDGELRFYVNKGDASASEAGRFDSEGMLKLCGGGSSHLTPSFTSGVLFTSRGDNNPHIENKVNHTNSFGLYKFENTNGTAGSISMFSTSVSYNTSSDYRLKENVNYTWNATNKLKQLKPCEFEFKADSDNVVHQGFLAHEVDSIVPTSVFGEKDGEQMQQLDHSKLVPLMVKTIQELEARIKVLEG